MRADLLIMALVLLAGLGVSALLVPRGPELALQHFRDQDYAAARAEYEARFEAGDHGAGTVMPLARLYTQEGNVDRAITLIEAFVAREPGQIEARELLGKLYRDSERLGDYLENLEAIATLKPGEEVYRELAGFYAFLGDYDEQAEALKRLVAIRPNEVQAATDLGQLLAVRGRPEEAVAALSAADDRAADRGAASAGAAFDGDARVLLLSLLMDQDRADEALRRADRWLSGNPPTYAILALTGMMMERRRPDLAYRMLRPFAERAKGEPVLELTLIDLEIANDRVEEARALLREWRAAKPVDDASLGRFVALAMNAGLPALALEMARTRDLHLIPGWVVAGLAQRAFADHDAAFLDRMVRELGDGFLSGEPLLAGEIALVRGDRPAAARWAERAADAAGMADRLTAVDLLARAGRRDLAAAALERLRPGPDLPDDQLAALSSLYADLGRAKEGLAWFAARRRDRPSEAAEFGWARLAARAGDPAEVAAWLDAHPTVDAGLLQDIASLAAEREDGALALKAAERLYALAPTPRGRLALANALLAAGRAADALPHLRALLGDPALTEVPGLYLAALEAAGSDGDLIDYLNGLIAGGGLDEKQAEQAASLLLDRKAYKAALPLLRDLAEKRGGDWLPAYADAAVKAGDPGPVADLLAAALVPSGMTDADREKLAYLLMDIAPDKAGPPLSALAGADPERWWQLAAEAWRRAGRTDDLAALLGRLLKVGDLPAKTREAMAFVLLDEGGPVLALPVLKELAEAAPAGPWDGYVREALTKAGRRDELRAWLRARAADARLPARERRALAFTLLEGGDKRAAESVFRALAAGQGPDGPDARQLLFLWGPRPPAEALDWIEARARAAKDPAQRAAWYDRLVQAGGAKRLTAATGALPDGPLRGPYIEALAAEGKGRALAAAVRAAVPEERDPETLRRWARLAEAQREGAAAAVAWKAVLTRKPGDGEALRQLGMAAFDQGDLAAAERDLRRFLAGGRDDYEANYFLAEALTGQKRGGEAAPFYRASLAQLRALAPAARTDSVRQIEAGLLNRLGRVDESVALFETLRRRRPGDRQLLADYAAMLIENRRVKEARDVLDQK